MLFVKRHSTKIIHVFIWLMLLHLIFDLSGIFESLIDLFRGERIDEGIIMIPSLIALFYINLNVLFPRFVNASAWLKYMFYLMVLIGTFIGIGSLLLLLFQYVGVDSHVDLIDFFDFSIVFYLVAVGISSSIGFNKIADQKEMQKKEAVGKQRIAEMKFLSTQVSPHFLFNSLNSIYSLAEEENASLTSDAIIQLSEMMRYPFTDGLNEKVNIRKEIEFIENYLRLQQTKLGDDYPIEFECVATSEDLEVAPLLFIPIVENAFKYGISHVSPELIIIKLSLNNNSISFLVRNTMYGKNDQISNQVGLKNLKERLELIYPEKYVLDISQANNQFIVKLDIEL